MAFQFCPGFGGYPVTREYIQESEFLYKQSLFRIVLNTMNDSI
jgi:hypothetical protein